MPNGDCCTAMAYDGWSRYDRQAGCTVSIGATLQTEALQAHEAVGSPTHSPYLTTFSSCIYTRPTGRHSSCKSSRTGVVNLGVSGRGNRTIKSRPHCQWPTTSHIHAHVTADTRAMRALRPTAMSYSTAVAKPSITSCTAKVASACSSGRPSGSSATTFAMLLPAARIDSGAPKF